MPRNRESWRLAACGLGLLSALAGCSHPPEAPKGNDTIKPTYNARSGRLEKITYDRNGDGKVDAWMFMEGTRVVRADLDENFDGRADRWEHYDGNATSPTRIESSTHGDGRVSRWDYYEKGERARAEEDTDGDSRIDKWETWAGGSLTAVLLDTDGDGTADRRLVYPGDGSSPRFEVADSAGHFRPAQ